MLAIEYVVFVKNSVVVAVDVNAKTVVSIVPRDRQMVVAITVLEEV